MPTSASTYKPVPQAMSSAFNITAAPPPPFFFNDTATTEIYTLSLHDALPIFTVTALDASGNTVTSFTGAVAIAIDNNPAVGTLTGNAPVNAVNGVATFANQIGRASCRERCRSRWSPYH